MNGVVVGAVVTVLVGMASVPWQVGGRRGSRPRAGPTGRAAVGRVLSRRPRTRARTIDPAFVLDLCAAAVRGGAAVPAALVVTGRHLAGEEGDALVRVGTALGLGTPWGAAWADAPPSVAALGAALRTGWDAGASPASQLRAAAVRLRHDRRARARVAAGALGVRLTLPLGLCFLPAFVLLGLAPVVLGLADDLGWAGS